MKISIKNFLYFLSTNNFSAILTAIEHIHHSKHVKVVVRKCGTSFVVVTVLVQARSRHSKPKVSNSISRVEVERVELENSKLNFLAIELNDLNGNRLFEILHIWSVEILSSTCGNCECFEHRTALELGIGNSFAVQISHQEIGEVQQDGVGM